MRIAFITSEFAGLPGSGGIGTYYLQAAQCLVDAGHEIEVFTSGTPGQLSSRKGILFHQLGSGAPPAFSVHAAETLAARHRESAFDLLESAELKAEGLPAARAVPDIAHVIRIHSPSVVLNRYLDLPPTRGQRLTGVLRQARIALGAWRRGLPIPPIHFDLRPPLWFPSQEHEERNAAASADLVIVMNDEMHRLVRDYWWIRDEAIRNVPNPFRSTSTFALPGQGKKQSYTLGFAGRLEPRKGLLELAEALKEILPRHPDWNVVIAGHAVPSCLSGADVEVMARARLQMFGDRVQFLGRLSPERMEGFLAELDLYVFPSLWDNFPYAVLEAMAAGKAIVGTRTGAVADMLDEGKAGLLVEPGQVRQLAHALDTLMGDPRRRKGLGEAARQRLHSKYSEEAVTPAILEVYQAALERRDRRIAARHG